MVCRRILGENHFNYEMFGKAVEVRGFLWTELQNSDIEIKYFQVFLVFFRDSPTRCFALQRERATRYATPCAGMQ